MADNFLFYGDNLDVLRRYVGDGSIDLVYLDPPFNSNQDCNVLFADHGVRSVAQIKAFGDTWQGDQAAAHDYQETVEGVDNHPWPCRRFEPCSVRATCSPSNDGPRFRELHRALQEMESASGLQPVCGSLCWWAWSAAVTRPGGRLAFGRVRHSAEGSQQRAQRLRHRRGFGEVSRVAAGELDQVGADLVGQP